jgi:hypothetical protein
MSTGAGRSAVPCIHNSVKPEFFVEREVCRLRCLQIARLTSRIRAIDHWS